MKTVILATVLIAIAFCISCSGGKSSKPTPASAPAPGPGEGVTPDAGQTDGEQKVLTEEVCENLALEGMIVKALGPEAASSSIKITVSQDGSTLKQFICPGMKIQN